MKPATPILPEEWGRTSLEGMQEHTDLPRCGRRSAIPLAVLAERTGATRVDAGGRDQTQASIGFSTLLLVMQRLPCGTPHRPIRLEGNVLSREAPSLPGSADHRLAISLFCRVLPIRLRESRGTRGRAHGRRFQLLSSFEAQVPCPLRDDLPGFVSTCSMRAPPIRVVLTVFIRKGRLKGTTMQGERHDIRSGKGLVRQRRHTQLGDQPITQDPNPLLRATPLDVLPPRGESTAHLLPQEHQDRQRACGPEGFPGG